MHRLARPGVRALSYFRSSSCAGLRRISSGNGSVLLNRLIRENLTVSSYLSVDEKRFIHSSVCLWGDIIEVNTPPFAESITEGDIRWMKGVGEAVAEDEVIGEVETDKTSIPVQAPSAGVITELLVPDGEKVTAGMMIFKMEKGAAGVKSAEKVEAAPGAAPEPAAEVKAEVKPSEPIPSVQPPVPPPPQKPIASQPAKAIPPPVYSPSASPSGARTEKRVKMTRMRLRIAERLKSAQNTAAMLTTFNEIDMSNVAELRKTYQDQFMKKHKFKLGFMSAFLKASAQALEEMPDVNAVIDDTTNEIVYRDYVDISVAVATPKGLVVPVLRDLGGKNYAEIEQALQQLGEKAKNNALAIEDMDGGTFTISNGGVFGSLFGTPIINPPQSAILGMHGIFDRPVAVNGKIEIRPMMYVALTYDHRLVDGREGVTFLRKIKSAVEDPRTLLLGL